MLTNAVRISIVGESHSTIYESCVEAEKATGINQAVIHHWMRNRPGQVFQGKYRIRPVVINEEKGKDGNYHAVYNKNNCMTHNKPTIIHKPVVHNETTDKYYTTLGAASKEAGVNAWTFSAKLEKFGYFKAKNGDVYKRLIPMNRRTTTPLSAGTVPEMQKINLKKRTYVPRDNTPLNPVEDKVITEPKTIMVDDEETLQAIALKFIKRGDAELARPLLDTLILMKKRKEMIKQCIS